MVNYSLLEETFVSIVDLWCLFFMLFHFKLILRKFCCLKYTNVAYLILGTCLFNVYIFYALSFWNMLLLKSYNQWLEVACFFFVTKVEVWNFILKVAFSSSYTTIFSMKTPLVSTLNATFHQMYSLVIQ